MNVNQSILFEQPVNELMRVCLRMEHLLMMAQQGLRGQHIYDIRSAIGILIDMLALTDRPDLRGKFIKEFLRQQGNFQRFLNSENIDQTKLQLTLSELDKSIQLLQNGTGKFALSLRENEFLTGVRQHFAMPGSALSFDTPAFFYWLQHPINELQGQISAWMSEFDDISYVIQFLLRLIRQSGQSVLYTAYEGFFQLSLDPQLSCQLVRVFVPNTLPVFPEISVGRHGVSIRFYYPTIRERAVTYEKDVAFRLSNCIL